MKRKMKPNFVFGCERAKKKLQNQVGKYVNPYVKIYIYIMVSIALRDHSLTRYAG